MINLQDYNHSIKIDEGGILIPFSILTDSSLTFTEKIIYSYILSFSINKLDFFQSTTRAAAKLNINPSLFRRSVGTLIKKKYLYRIRVANNDVIRVLLSEPADQRGCIESIQTVENRPRVSNSNSSCYESIQDVLRIDTHNNNINNNINNNNNKQNLDNYTSKQETSPKTKDAEETNTPKKPKRKTNSENLISFPTSEGIIKMSQEKWDRLVSQIGLECALFLCEEIEDWAQQNSKKFDKWVDHYKAILKWNQRSIKDGYVFGLTPNGGHGYYKPWTGGLVVLGGANG